MIVATYNLQTDKTRIHRRAAGLGRRRWKISLFAANDDGKVTHELRPKGACYLVEVLPLATQAIDELLNETGRTLNDGGFQVVMLR
tara:strand:- start:560 stop:817 length:258 start_codon:yes stop_codon:yes gene_type:complete